jgi:long-chain acyl-CoA synthetase
VELTAAVGRLAGIEQMLLAPGAPFETEEAIVLGERMRVFKQRARSLRELVENSRAFGDADYLVFRDGERERRISFRTHARLVSATAAALRERHGVGPGDRVAILAANCPEWIIAFFATVSLGAIAVSLNAWWTGPEIRFALDHSAPKMLVVDAKRFARLEGDVRGVQAVVVEDGFAELTRSTGEVTLPDIPIAEDDPAAIVYTSGTTGRPKGAVHSHRNVIALFGNNSFHGARLAALYPPPADSPNCVLVTSPLFHVSGLHSVAIPCLARGVRTVWPVGRFDARSTLSLIERERITAWSFTQTTLHRVVHHPEVFSFDRSSLRQLGGGGSPIPPDLQARAREVFPGVANTLGVGYGLTECTALATLNPGDELRAHPDSAGRPLPTVDVEIRGEHGRAVAEGVEGEVHVRGPLVMLEYWQDPSATSEVILPGRWLRTGDIGRVQDGRLYLASRKRDLILRGGENVYPAEIEQRLEQHPDVAEVAVIGVEHPEFGQEVKAIVVAAPGVRPDIDALARWVGDALAYFKVPTRWEVRGEPLPRNATGKVLKEVLRTSGESPMVPE